MRAIFVHFGEHDPHTRFHEQHLPIWSKYGYKFAFDNTYRAVASPPLRCVYISHPRPALVSWCPSATQPAGFVLQVVPESRRVKRNITIVSEAPAGAEPSESRYPKLDRQTWDRMLNMHGKPGVESAEEPGVVLRWEALTDGGTYYVPQDGAARARMKRVRAGSQHA